MIILGIDPSSRLTGFGVIEECGNSLKYIDSGTLRFNEKIEFLDRFSDYYSEMKRLVEKYRPDEVAFEALIFRKNPSSLIKLAQTRGAMICAFSETHKGKIFEYAPNLVKSSPSGHGHASKLGVQKVLNMLLGNQKYETEDASDAVAIAVTHSLNRKRR